METKGKIRVGTCLFDKKKRPIYPNYEGYTNIVVMTKSYCHEWACIGPYELKDEKGRIMENVWQASKIYKYVPPISQNKRGTNQKIWEHPYEIHIDDNNNVTKNDEVISSGNSDAILLKNIGTGEKN